MQGIDKTVIKSSFAVSNINLLFIIQWRWRALLWMLSNGRLKYDGSIENSPHFSGSNFKCEFSFTKFLWIKLFNPIFGTFIRANNDETNA